MNSKIKNSSSTLTNKTSREIPEEEQNKTQDATTTVKSEEKLVRSSPLPGMKRRQSVKTTTQKRELFWLCMSILVIAVAIGSIIAGIAWGIIPLTSILALLEQIREVFEFIHNVLRILHWVRVALALIEDLLRFFFGNSPWIRPIFKVLGYVRLILDVAEKVYTFSDTVKRFLDVFPLQN